MSRLPALFFIIILKTTWKYRYNRFHSNFESWYVFIGNFLDVFTGIASVVCLVSLTVYVGFDLSADDSRRIMHILRSNQLTFAVTIIYNLIFRFRHTLRTNRIIKWVGDVAVLLTLIAWLYPNPQHPWFPWLSDLINSNKFLFLVLGVYSAIDMCYALSRIPGRRTNPSLMMAVTFLFFIIAGSFVLMLPKCTYHGISFFDSFFVSSSAVCITGLTPVDIPSTFTPLGILVISILVQLGSLGVITFTSFFALFFTGKSSIYNQLVLRDMIYSKSMNALIPTMLYVLGFTVVIEIVGAVCVYFTLPPGLGLNGEEKIIFSAFHSMSSFCNAGFSCLPGGMANTALMHSNQVVYIVTCVLIFAGAVGFPILVNLKVIIRYWLQKGWNRLRHRSSDRIPLHIFDLNTKIVLVTTSIILLIGTVSFFILEYDNSLKGMSLYEKCVQSLFNSLVPRSAGFATVNPSTFLDITLLIVLVQMVIGGSAQSMAGGIKVNTIGVLWLNLKAVIRGHKGVSAFHRAISTASVRRANAIFFVGMTSLVLYTITVLCLEPHLPTKSLVFETVSALFTVGSSLGITDQLGDTTKILLSSAMFLGRVGILSLLMGMLPGKHDTSTLYPEENIIIN